MSHSGNWHGKQRYFGLHYDLHANAKDTSLGVHCSPEDRKALKRDYFGEEIRIKASEKERRIHLPRS